MDTLAQRAVTGTYRVDASRGSRIGTVSSQWFSRPDDQRFLSLADLADHVERRSRPAVQQVVDVEAIRVEAETHDHETLTLSFDRNHGTAVRDIHPVTVAPTHWSFGQLASLAHAPAAYLRQLPAKLAGVNLQYGLANLRSENVKVFYSPDGELMAATGSEYGRVYDWEVVRAVQRIAGNGVGETRWKVPGVLDWGTSHYNPFVDPTKHTTTLYASDRDVFVFLVDDTHPIEIGKLPDGSPDLVFRGFYVWNSEVGRTTLGISTFLLRAVCANRNIWGAQDMSSITVRHSKGAPSRFIHEVQPALLEYSNSSDRGVIVGIEAARKALVARSDDDRVEFLAKRGFNKAQAARVIERAFDEEGRRPESVWDFVQGISAVARDIPHQDARIELERHAGAMLTAAMKRAA